MDSFHTSQPLYRSAKSARMCHFFQVGKCNKSDCKFLHVLSTTNTNDQSPNKSFSQRPKPAAISEMSNMSTSTATVLTASSARTTQPMPDSQKELTIDGLVVSLKCSGFEIDRIVSLEPKLIMNNLSPAEVQLVVQTLRTRPASCISSVRCNRDSVSISLPNETTDIARVCKIINSMFSFTEVDPTKRAVPKSQFGDTIVWKGAPASGIIGLLGEIPERVGSDSFSNVNKFCLTPDKIALLLLSGSKNVFVDDIFSLKIYQSDLIPLGNVTLSKYLKSIRPDVVVHVVFAKKGSSDHKKSTIYSKYCDEFKVHVVLCDVRQPESASKSMAQQNKNRNETTHQNNTSTSDTAKSTDQNKLVYTQVTIVGGTDAARLQVRRELQALTKPTIVKLSYAEILQIEACQGVVRKDLLVGSTTIRVNKNRLYVTGIPSKVTETIGNVHRYLDTVKLTTKYVTLENLSKTVSRAIIANKESFRFAQVAVTIKGSVIKLKGVECNVKACESLINKIYREHNLNNSSTEQEQDPRTNEHTCQICFCEDETVIHLLECNHHICKDCFLQMTKHSSIPLTCSCDGKTPIPNKYSYLLYPEEYERLLQRSLEEFLNKNHETYAYCPSQNCNMIHKIGSGSGRKELIACSSCSSFHCTDCGVNLLEMNKSGTSHYQTSCEHYKKEVTQDSEFEQYLASSEYQVKRCPACKMIIQKDGGCQHMRCKKCKYEFCWACQKKWKTVGCNYYSHA